MGEFVPGYESSTFYGVGAPQNTRAEIIDKLNKQIFGVNQQILGRGQTYLSDISLKVIWEKQRTSTFSCMSSEHFGQLAWQFKRVSGSSGLKVQAAIAC